MVELSDSADRVVHVSPSSGQMSLISSQTCVSGEFTTPRAILTGHDCEVTCASVCAELGLVISGCKGETCQSKKSLFLFFFLA